MCGGWGKEGWATAHLGNTSLIPYQPWQNFNDVKIMYITLSFYNKA